MQARGFILTLLITIGLLMAACDAAPAPSDLSPAATSTAPAAEQPATAGTTQGYSTDSTKTDVNTEIPEIQEKMLYSHAYWQTLWVDATVESYAGDGSLANRKHVQMWIEKEAGKFLVLSGLPGGSAEQAVASDGENIQVNDYLMGTSSSWQYPDYAREPFSPPEPGSGTIYPYPLSQHLQTPLSDLIFPTALAQREGSYTSEGRAPVAGRDTEIIAWAPPGESVRDRLWVDVQTGMVLSRQSYSKAGGDTLSSIMTVHEIVLDAILPSQAFVLDATLHPNFSQSYDQIVYTTPMAPAATDLSVPPAEAQYGYIYFVVNEAGNLRLVRFPADCILLDTPCPAVGTVAGYPNIDSSIEPLIWNNDGTQAALVVNNSLYIYDPRENSWLLLVRADSFYPPVWSPDGNWLAYIATIDNSQSVYIVHPDGTGLQDLTTGRLPRNTYYGSLMWVNDGEVAFATQPPGKRMFYTWSLNNRLWEEHAFEGMGLKDTIVFSAVGNSAALVNYTETGVRISVANPVTADPQEITFLENSSIWPVALSADGTMVAFNAYLSTGSNISEVYISRTDGKGESKLVYRGSQVFSLHWGPTNQNLLLEVANQSMGQQASGQQGLVMVNVENSRAKVINLSGYDEQAWISGVSWQPVGK